MAGQYIKDPQATLDYPFDWTAWLATGETITTFTVTVPTGLVQATPAPSATATTVTVWLAGGTPGQRYTVACRVVTSAGRDDTRSIQLLIQDR